MAFLYRDIPPERYEGSRAGDWLMNYVLVPIMLLTLSVGAYVALVDIIVAAKAGPQASAHQRVTK